MAYNIFFENKKTTSLNDYLNYNQNSRENLGADLPVLVYRMLEYSMKEELRKRFGRDEQIDIFRSAGYMAGEYFANNYLNLDEPLEQFVKQLQEKLQALKIGVLRIEDVNEENGKIMLTVSEDADCSGLPVLGETVCNYDEGFISAILSVYFKKPYEAIEIDCWATGDRVCRFCAEIKEK